jgi:hypothetical protein
MNSLLRVGQTLGLLTVATGLVVLGASPASAAPPLNDTIDTAKAITAVPYADTVDTTEATTDAEDAAINASCGAPVTNGSVWYTLQASLPLYLVDVSQSDFEAGVIVATGTPGNLSIVTCGPLSVAFEAVPGETYYVMAFSDTPGVVGGQLSIAVSEGEPAPKIAMTVDDVGKVNRSSGYATISGTYTCAGTADFVAVQGRLQQQQGDIQVGGFFELQNLPCGGTFPWSIEVAPESGKYKRGLAATAATSIACNSIGCNFYDTTEVVQLRNGR